MNESDAFDEYVNRHYKRAGFRHMPKSQVSKLFLHGVQFDPIHAGVDTGDGYVMSRFNRIGLWRDLLHAERKQRLYMASLAKKKFQVRMSTLSYGHPLKQAQRRSAALKLRKEKRHRAELRANDKLVNGVDEAIRRHNIRKKFPNGLPVMSGPNIRYEKPAWW